MPQIMIPWSRHLKSDARRRILSSLPLLLTSDIFLTLFTLLLLR